jgi:hypothetical protein
VTAVEIKKMSREERCVKKTISSAKIVSGQCPVFPAQVKEKLVLYAKNR